MRKYIIAYSIALVGCQTPMTTPVGPLFTDKDIKATQVNPELFIECQPILSSLEANEPNFNDLANLIGKHVKEYSDCVAKDKAKTAFLREAFPQKTQSVSPTTNTTNANIATPSNPIVTEIPRVLKLRTY